MRTPTATPRSRRRLLSLLVGSSAALTMVVSLVAFAAAAATTTTIGSAANATLGERVAVNSQDRTLYALAPETSHHLLCRSSVCLSVWPPVLVSSARAKLKEAAGVHGRLGLVRRGGGKFQVTLGGMPLYRFAGDRGKDESNGQGIESFGGTWHAVAAGSAGSPPTPAAPSPMPSSPAPTPGYAY